MIDALMLTEVNYLDNGMNNSASLQFTLYMKASVYHRFSDSLNLTDN